MLSDLADKDLERFAKGRGQWIVAVHMVSEGIDIPRLRAGVFASHVTTQQYLEQFSGRFVRAGEDRTKGTCAVLWVPAHPTLVERVRSIEEQVRLALRQRKQLQTQQIEAPAVPVASNSPPSQYSALAGGLVSVREQHIVGAVDVADVESEEAPWDKKEQLREQVNDLVNQLHRISGEAHAKIHGRFSRQFGDTLQMATERTLQRRIERLQSAIQRHTGGGSPATQHYGDYGQASLHTA